MNGTGLALVSSEEGRGGGGGGGGGGEEGVEGRNCVLLRSNVRL